jgi:preprotein translocase subunit SecG
MTALVRFGFGFFLVFSAFFLIALVLIQRGRGGGLAGAFGGAGGQSAFGTKAGDVFTKITVVVAACWILLCILALNVLGRSQSLFSPSLGASAGQAVPSRTPAADTSSSATTEPAAPTTPAATSEATSEQAATTTAEGAKPENAAAPADDAPAK